MNNIDIRFKNEDGSYDDSTHLYKDVDAYDGDLVNRILEISPAISGTTPKNVKFRLTVMKDGNAFKFLPKQAGSDELVSEYVQGFIFYMETGNGQRLYPDEKGIVALTDNLVAPIEVKLWSRVEKFTVEDLSQNIILEDLTLEFWSK